MACTAPIRGFYRSALVSAPNHPTYTPLFHAAAKAAFYLLLSAGLPVNGSMYSSMLSGRLLYLLPTDFLCTPEFFCIFSYGIYVISSAPKIPVSILVFQVCMPVKYHRELFPFKYPIISDTLYFAVSSPTCVYGQDNILPLLFLFLSHNSLTIFPTSAFICLYIICLLYFGAKTMWYLHSHLVCAKLFFDDLFILLPPILFWCVVELSPY